MKVECLRCGRMNPGRAAFCGSCGERLSERAPTSIRKLPSPEPGSSVRVASVPVELGRIGPAAFLLLLLYATNAAAFHFVARAPKTYLATLAIQSLIVAYFALPEAKLFRPLLVFRGLAPRWCVAALLVGVLGAAIDAAGTRFTPLLGLPQDPVWGAWFEREGSSFALGTLCGVLLQPLVDEIALRGYVQSRLAGALVPLEASLVTAAVSSMLWLYPERLPFDFGIALLLCELRRRSGSLVPCLLAAAVAGAGPLVFG
jgi:membrane protease YdiL (CAAX protease family)